MSTNHRNNNVSMNTPLRLTKETANMLPDNLFNHYVNLIFFLISWTQQHCPHECISCHKTEDQTPFMPFGSFVATAERYGLRSGMYHDACFWLEVDEHQTYTFFLSSTAGRG